MRFPSIVGKRTLAAAVGAGLSVGAVTVWTPSVEAQGRAPLAELRSVLVGGPELGVTIRDITEADLAREKLADPSGAYVETVREDGAAASAGFEAGDVVVEFDGERVRSARQLSRLVEETPAGRQVEVAVLRAGSRVTLQVAPEQAPSALARAGAVVRRRAPDLNLNIRPFTGRDDLVPVLPFFGPGIGASVQELTDQLGVYFGVADGVLVTSVTSGTPAEAAGLKAGDVITKVGETAVGSAANLRRRLAEASGRVVLTIVRDRKEQTLTLELDRPDADTGTGHPI